MQYKVRKTPYSLICAVSICCGFGNSSPISDCNNVVLRAAVGCKTKFDRLSQMLNMVKEQKRGGSLLTLRSPLLALRNPLLSVRSPLFSIRSPLLSMRSPRLSRRSPLLSVRSPLLALRSPLLSL